MEIDYIAYFHSEHNIADTLTKIKQTSLLISATKLDHTIEKWIVRGK